MVTGVAALLYPRSLTFKKSYLVPTPFISAFFIDFKISTAYFPTQYKLVSFYIPDGVFTVR